MGIHFLQRGLISISVTSFLAGLTFYILFSAGINGKSKSSNPVLRIIRSVSEVAKRRPFFNFIIMSALVGILSGIAILALLISSVIDLHRAVLLSNEVAAYLFLLLVLGVFGEIVSSGPFRERN